MNLSERTLISRAISPADGAAGTTDIEGVVLDMANADGVLMIVMMGAITATAVTSIKAQQGDESDLSDAADLEGSGQTIADDDDNKVFVIDLAKPTKRYVRVYVDRGTANAVVAGALYQQYGLRKQPPTHGSNVSAEVHASPDEGTA